MKRSTIIFASHAAGLIGGAERSLLEIIIDSKKQGYTPILVVPADGDLLRAAKQLSIDCRVIPYGWWASLPNETPHLTGPNPDHSPIPQFINLIKEVRPLAAISNTSVIPWLAYACAIIGVRHAWIVRELGKKDHGLHFVDGDKHVYDLINLLSDAIFANSISVQKHLLSHIPDRQKIPILYPVVQPVTAKQKNTPPSNPIRIIAVGQIKPSKGQFDAVKAISLLRQRGIDCCLDIVGGVGDVKYKEEIDKYIKTKLLGNYVTFAGHQKNPYISKEPYHIAVVCSRFEAFGRVTVEAMLHNIPVVGANSGGTAEIITHLKTGLLYEAEKPAALAEEITKLIRDPELSKKLSRSAFDYAKDTFSRQSSHRPFFKYLETVKTTDDFPSKLASLSGLMSDYIQLSQSYKSTGEIYDTMMKQAELIKEKDRVISVQRENIRTLSTRPLNRLLSIVKR